MYHWGIDNADGESDFGTATSVAEAWNASTRAALAMFSRYPESGITIKVDDLEAIVRPGPVLDDARMTYDLNRRMLESLRVRMVAACL